MEEIKLSFIVPMYNAEKYLNLCFDSLLNQDIPHAEYEIICVNDGSTDSTKEICQEYKAKFSNFHYFEQENKGVSCARNFGLTKATGKYIWFIDSDDEILKNSLNRILFEIFNEDLDVLEVGLQRGKVLKNEGKEFYFKSIEQFKRVSGCVKIVKKKILIQNSIYFIERLKYAEDHIWCLQLEKAANKILFCSNIIYFYRINNTSVTMEANSHEVVFKSLFFLLCATKGTIDEKDRNEFQRILIWVIFMTTYSIEDKLKLITILELSGDYPYKNILRRHFRGTLQDFRDRSFTQLVKNIVSGFLRFCFQYKKILILFFYIKEFLMNKPDEDRPTLDMEEIKRLYYGK